MSNNINLRNIYKTPAVNATANDRNDLINAMRSQGLTEDDRASGVIGQSFKGIIGEVDFNFTIAFNMNAYSHVKGIYENSDYKIESFDLVTFNTIPDLRRIAANIRNKAVEIETFPTVTDVSQNLPGLETGLKWVLTRDINISSSGKLNFTWNASIRSIADNASVNLAYRSVKSNAKSGNAVYSMLEIGPMIERANETIQEAIKRAENKNQRRSTKDAFKPVNDFMCVGRVEPLWGSAEVHIDVRVDQIPALLEFLALLDRM